MIKKDQEIPKLITDILLVVQDWQRKTEDLPPYCYYIQDDYVGEGNWFRSKCVFPNKEEALAEGRDLIELLNHRAHEHNQFKHLDTGSDTKRSFSYATRDLSDEYLKARIRLYEVYPGFDFTDKKAEILNWLQDNTD